DRQNTASSVLEIPIEERIEERLGGMTLNQVPEHGLAIVSDREVQRNRVAGNGSQLLNFFRSGLQPSGDLLVARSTAQFLLQFPRNPHVLVHAFVHVDRETDRARLIGNGAGG